MSDSSGTTFEVFHDYGFDRTNAAEINHALDYIATLIPDMNVLSVSRSIRIGKPSDDTINPLTIRWPELSAAINVILTPRSIIDSPQKTPPYWQIPPEHTAIRGIAIAGDYRHAQVALVNTEKPSVITAVFTHEVGHLFKLKNYGITKDRGSNHCLLMQCVMNESVETEPVVYKKKNQGIKGLLQKIGIKSPEYSVYHKPIAQAFCTECTDQFKQVAYFRKQARLGKFVMQQWV